MRRTASTMILISALILLLAACDPFSYEVEREYHALVFSADYQNSDDARDHLFNTVHDGDDMKNLLNHHGYSSPGSSDVDHQTNVTKAQILTAIDQLADTAGSDDISIFYYSGHGGYSETLDSSYLVSYDMAGLYSDELLEALAEVPGKKIIILDICNSGGFVPDDGFDADGIGEDYSEGQENSVFFEAWGKYFSSEETAYPDITVISAAGQDEFSWEAGGSISNGFFTYALLTTLGYDHDTLTVDTSEAFADQNGDGIITATELYGQSSLQLKEQFFSWLDAEDEYLPHISGGVEDVILFVL